MVYNDLIYEYLIQNGATLVGFADLSVLPKEIRLGYRYGISIGVALDPKIVSKIPTGPHMAYYDECNNVLGRLNPLAQGVVALIEQKDYDAFPQIKRNTHRDNDHRTRLPHKTIATLSGLGWIGKSALLINEIYGGAVRYTSVLTNMPLEVGQPITESLCGDCSLCAMQCPAKTIRGNNWIVGMDREELLNAHQCKQTVLERGKALGITHASCGMCVAVCPYTQG